MIIASFRPMFQTLFEQKMAYEYYNIFIYYNIIISPCDRYWWSQATVPKVDGGGGGPIYASYGTVPSVIVYFANSISHILMESHIVMEILSHSCGSLPQTRSHMLVLNQFIIRLGFEPFNYNWIMFEIFCSVQFHIDFYLISSWNFYQDSDRKNPTDISNWFLNAIDQNIRAQIENNVWQ